MIEILTIYELLGGDPMIGSEVFRPNLYVQNIIDIPFEVLKKRGIRVLFCDLDNTLKTKGKGLDKELVNTLKDNVKAGNIEHLLLLTNTIVFWGKKIKTAKSAAEKLEKEVGIPVYLICLNYFQRKPKSYGFEKGLEIIGCNKSEVCMIGDQLHSDIHGGNKAGLYTVLVDPIDPKGYSWVSVVSLRIFRNNRTFKRLGL